MRQRDVVMQEHEKKMCSTRVMFIYKHSLDAGFLMYENTLSCALLFSVTQRHTFRCCQETQLHCKEIFGIQI